jgi:catechol 2,3-dioxygenase-like lactoylglutathione lyase family enzyme
MTAIARLAAVSLDAADPAELAGFYREILELDLMWESEDFIALSGAGIFVTFQRVADHQPPDWPSGTAPKQIHLELAVDDLEAAEARALELGARKAAEQPSPERWRVLLDPAGHPFCITTLIPDA